MRSYRRYFYDGFLRENGLKFAFFATVYREQLLHIFYLVVVFVKHLINVKLLSTFWQKPWPRLLGDLIGERALKTHFPASYSEFLSLFLRSEEHTSELQSRFDLVCRLLLEKKNTK